MAWHPHKLTSPAPSTFPCKQQVLFDYSERSKILKPGLFGAVSSNRPRRSLTNRATPPVFERSLLGSDSFLHGILFKLDSISSALTRQVQLLSATAEVVPSIEQHPHKAGGVVHSPGKAWRDLLQLRCVDCVRVLSPASRSASHRPWFPTQPRQELRQVIPIDTDGLN
jgi:hypothetical protein